MTAAVAKPRRRRALTPDETRAKFAAEFDRLSAGLAPPPRDFADEDRWARERLLFPYGPPPPTPPD